MHDAEVVTNRLLVTAIVVELAVDCGASSTHTHTRRVMTTTGVAKFIQGWFCTRVVE